MCRRSFILGLKSEAMVLGILTAVAACPAIIGTTEAVRQGQRNNAKERHRGQKANLIVSCSGKSKHAAQVNGGTVVLRNNKVNNYTHTPLLDDIDYEL